MISLSRWKCLRQETKNWRAADDLLHLLMSRAIFKTGASGEVTDRCRAPGCNRLLTLVHALCCAHPSHSHICAPFSDLAKLSRLNLPNYSLESIFSLRTKRLVPFLAARILGLSCDLPGADLWLPLCREILDVATDVDTS